MDHFENINQQLIILVGHLAFLFESPQNYVGDQPVHKSILTVLFYCWCLMLVWQCYIQIISISQICESAT